MNDKKIAKDLNKKNMDASNTFYVKGTLDRISGFISPDGALTSFVISGGVQDEDRYEPLYQVLDCVIGEMPTVILYAGDSQLEDIVKDVCCRLTESSEDASEDASPRLWLCNSGNPCFEPFFGMSDRQIISVLKQLAVKLNYTATPRFERVVKAHLRILKELNIPNSLSGLYYLCQFYDMAEFHENILALPCGADSARSIWADMGTDDESDNSQFDLFRTVVENLADDAKQSGWNPDNAVCDCNCAQAIENNATFLLSVNDRYTEMLLPYLTEELRSAGRPFFLLIDGVHIRDKSMLEYLSTENTGCTLGVLSRDVTEQFGTEESAFERVAKRIACFVLLKHGTAATAAKLSEIAGEFDYEKAGITRGDSKGLFDFWARDVHHDAHFETEKRPRVAPGDITGLGSDQAIIFDTSENQIVYYNCTPSWLN